MSSRLALNDRRKQGGSLPKKPRHLGWTEWRGNWPDSKDNRRRGSARGEERVNGRGEEREGAGRAHYSLRVGQRAREEVVRVFLDSEGASEVFGWSERHSWVPKSDDDGLWREGKEGREEFDEGMDEAVEAILIVSNRC